MLRSVSEFIGRFHPLIVHLPIGVLLVALLLQWLSQKAAYAVSHGVLKLLWALGVATAILSCLTGYLLSVQKKYDDTGLALHMWCGIAVAAVSLLLLAKVSARQNDGVYKSSAVFLVFLIAITSHLGGALTHGAGYLYPGQDSHDKTKSMGEGKPVVTVRQAYRNTMPVMSRK